jgi:DNA gyrase subunit A
VDEFREIGRNTQGVRILDLDGEGDRVVAVARLAESAEVLPEEGGG